jgi:serine/threonine protein kinase
MSNPLDDPTLEGVRIEGEFGAFEVERLLGEGAMARVYLGRNLNLDMLVVLKFPHDRLLGDPGLMRRFSDEIDGLVDLQHPHIVRIYARGHHGDRPFFAAQYLSGGTLGDRISSGTESRMKPESVSSWLASIAEALDFAHGKGRIHRDVKPENILFDEDGHAFLADFGIAKVLAEAGPRLTATGSGLGSPYHMAPEQALGDPVSGQADQYGLASTVFEALSGRPPFEGSAAVEVLVRKTKDDPPELRAMDPRISEELNAVVMRGLARAPEDRFPNCRAFAAAFAEAESPAPEPIPASPSSTGSGSAPPKRSRRVLILLVILVTLAAGAVTTVEITAPWGFRFFSPPSPAYTWPPTEGDYLHVEAGRGWGQVWGIEIEVLETGGEEASSHMEGEFSMERGKTNARHVATFGNVEITFELRPGRAPLTLAVNGRSYGTLQVGDHLTVAADRSVAVNGIPRTAGE